MKAKIIFLTLILSITLFTGCGGEDAPPEDNTPPDAVTTASIVDNNTDFEEGISENGTWIICTLADLTFDKELVLDGEFTNGKQDDSGKDIVQRKIALYEQDEDRNVTARYKLTAPKLTINSPEASIQHGTFIGDLYVQTNNFELVDMTIEGNVYFANDEARSSFTMDEDSTITGVQELAE